LPFVPRWAACLVDLVVAAGDLGVACVRQDDGQTVWEFAAPPSALYPGTADGRGPMPDWQAPESLSGFQLAAGRLFFFQGERRLFALDGMTGAVLWHCWAPGAEFRLPYPQGRFAPGYHAGPRTVLLQATAGKRLLLDGATGRTLHEAATARHPWPRPPLALDERTLCLVTDERHVVLIDTFTGRDVWTHTLTGASTLSGEAPQVFGRGETLLLVTARNIGYRLQRLDRATGKPSWSRSPLLLTAALDVSLWALDREAVYHVQDQVLIARSLTAGQVLWEQRLGEGSSAAWQVRRGEGWALAYPAVDTAPASAGASAARRFRFRSPAGSLQWDYGPLLAPGGAFPVLCCDPKTGRPVQRLNIRPQPQARTARQVRSTQGGRGRSLALRTSPLLASEAGPVVRFSPLRAVVAVGGDVWGLSVGEVDNPPASRGR
jgi:hypothetical protein